jgi:hypothetical protein
MELIVLSLFIIVYALLFGCIFKPTKEKRETTFKVDLGGGIETVSWSRLNHLTECEKEYLFKNAKQCSHLTGDLPDFNTENVVKISDFFRS